MNATTQQQSSSGEQPMKRKRFSYFKTHYQYYLLLLFPLAYFILFKYGPMYGLVIAFKDYNMFQGMLKSPWNDFDTFRQLFRMSLFYKVVRNTLLLNVIDILVSFPVPIVLALLLNELKKAWFKKGAQTILYLPHFISWIIIGGMVYQLFSTNTGLVNHFFLLFGIDPVPFLTNKYWWLFIYLAAGVWQSAGWGTILYLAALTGINKELYEAAEVDGASRLKRMWHISLPGIRSTIVILLILQIGHIMTIGFDRPFVLGNTMVMDYSEVISTFVYKVGIQSAQFSLATAIGFFQALIGLILVFAADRIAKRMGEQGIW
ncbi:ABC transporter permease subunit [Paenibacillus sp. HB172176]|uniref:ABC transporter permease n=1 Tax=Paenibacillus sp. HB172176 TaxID=2493690 RepID=UPI001439293E|nr:ABC transporter permease subunit [Paenibacillus sp. HB172176]